MQSNHPGLEYLFTGARGWLTPYNTDVKQKCGYTMNFQFSDSQESEIFKNFYRVYTVNVEFVKNYGDTAIFVNSLIFLFLYFL